MPADYLTLAAAAELLGCDANAVLRLADVGVLHPCIMSGRLMVPRAEVLGLIDLVGM